MNSGIRSSQRLPELPEVLIPSITHQLVSCLYLVVIRQLVYNIMLYERDAQTVFQRFGTFQRKQLQTEFIIELQFIDTIADESFGHCELHYIIVGIYTESFNIRAKFQQMNQTASRVFFGSSTFFCFSNATLSYCYNLGTVAPNSWEGDGGGTAKRGEIVGWSDNGNGVQHNWYKMGDTPVGDNGVNASDNNQFGNGTPGWPKYSTEASNGWGSSHWKSFSYGSIPELLWE